MGVRFGDGGTSTSTLSAGNTISVGGGGFTAGNLTLRNFTQSGGTAQAFTLTNTAYLQIYDASFDGNVSFTSPQILTRGSTYNGTAYLEKSGATSNSSAGGNTFAGDATLVNSGSGYFLMGNGTADDFQSDLTMNNTGTHYMYLAHNSAGNTVGGDLTVTVSGSGADQRTYICNTNGTSSLDVTGNVVFNNSSSATNNYHYIPSTGSMTVGGNYDVTVTSTSTGQAQLQVGSNATSTLDITGDLTISQTGSAGTINTYVGNAADVNIGGKMDLRNAGTGTTSQIIVANTADSDYRSEILPSCQVREILQRPGFIWGALVT